MDSATMMKSNRLCSSDPERSHCKKMKGNLLGGLQNCREVIFQVIKGDFYTVVIGISLAITQVLCGITLYALLTKGEQSSSPPHRFSNYDLWQSQQSKEF